MTYRDDLAAATSRAEAAERALRDAQAEAARDDERMQRLAAELAQAREALAKVAPAPEPAATAAVTPQRRRRIFVALLAFALVITSAGVLGVALKRFGEPPNAVARQPYQPQAGPLSPVAQLDTLAHSELGDTARLTRLTANEQSILVSYSLSVPAADGVCVRSFRLAADGNLTEVEALMSKHCANPGEALTMPRCDPREIAQLAAAQRGDAVQRTSDVALVELAMKPGAHAIWRALSPDAHEFPDDCP